MRSIAVGAALLWLSHTAWGDVFEHPVAGDPERERAMEALSAQLAERPQVQGDFIQEKHLTVLEQPLVSRGSFSFAGGAVTWRVEEPFAVTYRFAEGDLYRQDGDDEVQLRPADDPMLYGFFSFFNNLFDMSLADLDRLFRIYFEREDSHWIVGLEPRGTLLKDSIEAILVEGVRRPAEAAETVLITRVTIRESGGDYSRLVFSY